MRIKFEPRDIWIGVYWNKARTTTLDADYEDYKVYLCLLPLLPIVFSFRRHIPAAKRALNW